MFTFKGGSCIRSRVDKVVNATVEVRGAAWLLDLGYMECNDFAQMVVDQISYTEHTKEHVRFETVAKYIRQAKAKLRKANEFAENSNPITSVKV